MSPTTESLEAWLDSFPYDAVKAEMAKLQEELQVLNVRLRSMSEAIQLYERHRALLEQANGRPAAQTAPPAKAHAEPTPTLREAIRSVLAATPGREWHTDQLRLDLVNRSWLRDDAQGRNNLFAMLSVMAKQGQVQRVRTGWYRLPAESTELREVK